MDSKLLKGAQEVFKAHPKAKQVLATTDGQYFLPEAKDLANYHATKRGAKVIPIDRSEAFKEAPKKKKAEDPEKPKDSQKSETPASPKPEKPVNPDTQVKPEEPKEPAAPAKKGSKKANKKGK